MAIDLRPTLLLLLIVLIGSPSYSQYQDDPNLKAKELGISDAIITQLCAASAGEYAANTSWGVPPILELILQLEKRDYDDFGSREAVYAFLGDVWGEKYACVYCQQGNDLGGSLDMIAIYFGKSDWVYDLFALGGDTNTNINAIRPFDLNHGREGTLLDYVEYAMSKIEYFGVKWRNLEIHQERLIGLGAKRASDLQGSSENSKPNENVPTIVYFNREGRQTSVDSAYYYNVPQPFDSLSNLYPMRTYYMSGNLRLVGQFRDESLTIRTDTFKSYYPSTQLLAMATYNEGLLDGHMKTYHPNGQLASDVLYEQGKIVLIVSRLNTKGEKLPIGNFSNGEGTIYEYNGDHLRFVKTLENYDLHGDSFSFYFQKKDSTFLPWERITFKEGEHVQTTLLENHHDMESIAYDRRLPDLVRASAFISLIIHYSNEGLTDSAKFHADMMSRLKHYNDYAYKAWSWEERDNPELYKILLEKSADSPEESMFQLLSSTLVGKFYACGCQGFERDLKRGISYLEKAVSKTHRFSNEAYFQLGFAYMKRTLEMEYYSPEAISLRQKGAYWIGLAKDAGHDKAAETWEMLHLSEIENPKK